MRLILLLAFLATSTASAQTMVGDTLVTMSGYKIYPGMNIKLGSGSLPYGSFKYIQTSSASFLTAGGPQTAVGKAWGGHLFKVKKIKVVGNEKRGYRHYVMLGGGNIVNYEMFADEAIAAGEIVVPQEFLAKYSQPPSQISIAEELAKMKKLKDDGVLTDEEFAAQKAKLLAK